ncbi:MULTISPECIES: AMP-binding protein [unclassified Spongiibacter]|uniref:AMP-binding protein n=1 Tax=unclassified Spongiibacter TaxID=2631504 RepID=UPI000C098FE2|nr:MULTISPECIES: AMP-binding protein [unclassified Spongiibacter]MAK44370.1 AMP-binding protein [Spongiibacter sp.]|tara:strand:+ start:1757 stop:3412 length:1656 start_codon:yes stop_codon:yes gene_type:complete
MNASNYQEFAKNFSMEQIVQNFVGDFNDGLNVCEEICDRYATDESRVALRYERVDGQPGEMTFAELQRRSAQFAGFLQARGIGRGDRIACLLPRTPELLICVLGALRAGAVYQPLFTAFGSGAIEYRLQTAKTKLIVTNTEQWLKLREVKGLPTSLLLADEGDALASEADFLYWPEIERQSEEFAPVKISADEPFLQMFTSGTSGKSKGVAVPARALAAFWMYMRYAVGLREDDNFWNVADPGWAYGLYYAVVGPLLLGCTTHFNEASFTADNTFEFLRKYKISNLAAAPTAYRLLMANDKLLADYPEIDLRVASSAGEPLNPEVISWVKRAFDCTVCDHYGQTETGMTSANFHELSHPQHEASMGYQIPGYRLVALDENFNEVAPGQAGELAIDMENSPLYFFQGYTWDEKRPYHGKYYLTGDVVISNGDGSHAYTGRDDDIIASAGYRIGPAEVESSLLEHEAVVESGVVGKPDAKRSAIVKAYVVLAEGSTGDDALVEALQQHVRSRLSTHSYPREIEFVDALPKTSSGKIQRFVLRQRAEQEAQLSA